MASQTEIVNNALALLGEARVESVADDSDRARVMSGLWDSTLDAALNAHNWNFAQRRAALVEVSPSPEWDFAHQYQLPTSPFCLQILETDLDSEEPWRREAYTCGATTYSVIVTDAASVKILYVARVTDPNYWSPLFIVAMEYELAARACNALKGRDPALMEILRKQANDAWRAARSRDGQEGRALKRFLSDAFTKDR